MKRILITAATITATAAIGATIATAGGDSALGGGTAGSGPNCKHNCVDGQGAVGYAPISGEATAAGTALNQCETRTSVPFLILEPRKVRGRGRNFCKAEPYPVLRTTLTESLAKLNRYGYWDFKASANKQELGPGSMEVRASRLCVNRKDRYWRATVLACTARLQSGVVTQYCGSQRKFRFQACNA
jgi:hypothetical protein